MRRRIQKGQFELHRGQAIAGRQGPAVFPQFDAAPAAWSIAPHGLAGPRAGLHRLPEPPAETMANVLGAGGAPLGTKLRAAETASACHRHHHVYLLHVRPGVSI